MIKKSCEWPCLSSKPNVNWEIIRDNPNKPWNWDQVSLNPNVNNLNYNNLNYIHIYFKSYIYSDRLSTFTKLKCSIISSNSNDDVFFKRYLNSSNVYMHLFLKFTMQSYPMRYIISYFCNVLVYFLNCSFEKSLKDSLHS